MLRRFLTEECTCDEFRMQTVCGHARKASVGDCLSCLTAHPEFSSGVHRSQLSHAYGPFCSGTDDGTGGGH